MKHREGTLAGWQGMNLHYQSWHPDEPSQAVVTLVHGLGGYSNVFQNAVEYLVPQGYEVYAFDLRGHGRSAGQRGHINAWAEFREDLRLFLRFVRSQRTSCPMILWGHSLGGTIVLDYVLRSPDEIQGLIVTAPALGKVKISLVKLAIGRIMSRTVPRFSLRLGLRHLGASNPIVEAYLNDPLRHDYASARLATEYFSTVRWIYRHAAELNIPLLIMHGSSDHVTLPEGSRLFFQQVIFPDKEHREYPGNYHDLYMDADCELVFSDLKDWLKRHLIGAKTCQPLIIEA
ncbi:alpha/beta hydrolase [Leptolyngbya boryana CZ1]|uniref:Alpha/beta hydrolase n=1 Tax=Leptolyngbya boryana CZ1 TaxID=3060204 RepID=A0AA96WZX9_LEPBY|nr:alpha/beta hydrolase [Leptolyngbya boryana]WNZ48407.1 alpha/beta hydrolase [Leptolyngbya boryana CZ1]